MTPSAKGNIFWITVITGGLILLLLVLGPLIPYKKVRNLGCPISGSTQTEITWLGYFKKETRTTSALETWLRRKEPDFQPEWRPVSTQTYYVLGYSCGTSGSPQIYQLRGLLDEVVTKVSEARIEQLVAVLRHGSEAEQREMIQSIAEEVFARE